MLSRFLNTLRRYPLGFGVGLMFVLTWAVDLSLALQTHGYLPFHMPEVLGIFVGYGFVIATLLATAVVEGRPGLHALLRRYLVWRVGFVWYGVVLLGPVLIALLALLIDRVLGGPMPDFAHPLIRQLVPPILSLWLVAPIWLVWEMCTNGEEIGWRGYVLPRLLTRYNARVASLILGLVWALWHLPKFMMGGVQAETHILPFWAFMLNTVAFTFLITWVYNHTQGSLLLATLFHAASNTAFMCLPIVAGSRAHFLVIGIQCLLALGVVAMTGPNLTRRTSVQAESLRPGTPAQA